MIYQLGLVATLLREFRPEVGASLRALSYPGRCNHASVTDRGLDREVIRVQRATHAFWLPGMRFPRVPYRSSRGEIGATGRAPRRGEDNREVLRRLLDLDDAALSALEDRGALCAADDGSG